MLHVQSIIYNNAFESQIVFKIEFDCLTSKFANNGIPPTPENTFKITKNSYFKHQFHF